MTRISRKPLRGRRPVKRLDELKEMIRDISDDRHSVGLGVVISVAGEPHYTVRSAGDAADIYIDVELTTGRIPVCARLAANMWLVPDVGDEVVVLLPDALVANMPIVVSILAHAIPTEQGPAPNRIVIVRGEVLVHDGAGGAVPLALKSDVEAVDAKYANHLHGAAGAPTTGPLSAYVPGLPPVATPLLPATIVGTSVLKAK